jgi:hypothetical protein
VYLEQDVWWGLCCLAGSGAFVLRAFALSLLRRTLSTSGEGNYAGAAPPCCAGLQAFPPAAHRYGAADRYGHTRHTSVNVIGRDVCLVKFN